MNKLMKKIFNNPWIIAIFAPIITAILSSAWVSKTQNINIKESLSIIYNFIKSIFNYKIPIWSALLFILAIAFFKFIIVCILQKNNSKSIHEYPDWYYNFNTMNYKDWLFKWDYQMYANKYDIKNIRPICSCECELVRKNKVGNIHYGSPVLFCPNCQKIYKSPDMETIDELKKLISYNILKKQNPS